VKVGAEEDAEEGSEAQWLPARVLDDFNQTEKSYKVSTRRGEGAEPCAGGHVVSLSLCCSQPRGPLSCMDQVCMLVGYDEGDATFDVEAECVRAIAKKAGADVNPGRVDDGLQCKAWNPLEG